MMLSFLQSYLKDFTHLIFPHHCEGCGTDVLNEEDLLCAKCLHELPATNYFSLPANPVEKYFTEDVPLNLLRVPFILPKILCYNI